MPPKKNIEITPSDFDSLKQLLTKSTKSWTNKLLIPLLVGNLSIMTTVIWGAVQDHFLLKDLAVMSEMHAKQIIILTDQLIRDEKILIIHDEQIKHLQRKR